MLRRLYDATWGRIFALGYDRFQRRSEELGMRERDHGIAIQPFPDG